MTGRDPRLASGDLTRRKSDLFPKSITDQADLPVTEHSSTVQRQVRLPF